MKNWSYYRLQKRAVSVNLFKNLLFSATMKFLSAKDMMTPSTKVYKMLFLTSAKPAKKNL